MIGRNVARGSSLCGICLEASENSVLCLGKGLCTSHQGPSVSHFLRKNGTAQECDGLGRRSPRHLLLRHPPATRQTGCLVCGVVGAVGTVLLLQSVAIDSSSSAWLSSLPSFASQRVEACSRGGDGSLLLAGKEQIKSRQ